MSSNKFTNICFGFTALFLVAVIAYGLWSMFPTL